jgi:hypothetical protein
VVQPISDKESSSEHEGGGEWLPVYGQTY